MDGRNPVSLIEPVALSRQADIVRILCDSKRVTDSKIHPFAVLVATKTYSKGCGDLGSSTWLVNSFIVAALTTTFLLSFGNVVRTGKRIMLALDVSGSMSGANCAGSTSVNCREGSTAMAMATLRDTIRSDFIFWYHQATRVGRVAVHTAITRVLLNNSI